MMQIGGRMQEAGGRRQQIRGRMQEAADRAEDAGAGCGPGKEPLFGPSKEPWESNSAGQRRNYRDQL